MEEKELKILIALHKNTNQIDKKTNQIAHKHGITYSQFMVLEALYSKGKMTIGEVREHILSTKGTISVVVNNLEKLNYIKRLETKDKRQALLSLTETGKTLIETIIPENKTMIINEMKQLDTKEKSILLYLLKKLGGYYEKKD